MAIGKPFGLDNTMTAGIVSAKGRDLPQENLIPFIQTDVAINPGNSGGPLFNLRGEVVGINSLIFSRSGGYMGLAFAIPIDVAMTTVNQLKDKGKVTRGRIGVQIQEVTKELAEAFGLPKPTGALVNSVEKGGPADKGGVEPDDVIIKVDGRDVRSSNELPRIVTMVRPGTQDHADRLAQGRDARPHGDRRRDARRRRGARSSAGRRRQGEGQAEPDGPRRSPISPTSRRRSSKSRAACWSRTSPARCAATCSRAT